VHEWQFHWFMCIIVSAVSHCWRGIQHSKPCAADLRSTDFANKLACEMTGWADKVKNESRKRKRDSSVRNDGGALRVGGLRRRVRSCFTV